MARGEKETSTGRVGCRRGAPQESPTTCNLVATMPMEELRFFCQVPTDISLELLDEVAVLTIGWADNSVYFTLEQFVVGLLMNTHLSDNYNRI